MKTASVLLLVILPLLHTFGQKNKLPTKATIANADSLFTAGKFREAAAIYEAALKDPVLAKDPRSWFRLGSARASWNDHTNAIKAYERAWQLNSQQPGLRLAIARSYSAINNYDKAFAMLDSAIATGFGNFRLLETDPQLGNLKIDPRYKATHDRLIARSFPCLGLPEARMFDFWLGDWTVYSTANPAVQTGASKITRQSQGCVILESWTSVGPHEGVSISYFDPASGTWKQKWAGSGQDIVEFEGVFSDSNTLVFDANGTTSNGTPVKTRMTFSHLEPGKVRQHGEQSTDEGKTWTTTYDFTYLRNPDGANP